jgi:hypothetical protein
MENNNITDQEFIEAILYCGPSQAETLIDSFVVKNVIDNGINANNETCKKFFIKELVLFSRIEFWKFRAEFAKQTIDMNREKALTQDEIKEIGVSLGTAFTTTIKTYIDTECIVCKDFRS